MAEEEEFEFLSGHGSRRNRFTKRLHGEELCDLPENIPQLKRIIKNRRLDSPSVFAYFEFNSPDIVAIPGVLFRSCGTSGILPGITPDRLSSRSLEIETRYPFRRERERRDAGS